MISVAKRLLVVFLFLEVALRVGVYFVEGNPYYLFYGFQGVVPKPFSLVELQRAVEPLLSARTDSADASI